jgi:hypothetical protein
MPSTSEKLDTSPSCAEHRRPEPAGGAGAGPLGEPGHHQLVGLLVGGHRRGRVRVAVVVAGGLGPLHQPQDDQRPEPAGQPAEYPRPHPRPVPPPV